MLYLFALRLARESSETHSGIVRYLYKFKKQACQTSRTVKYFNQYEVLFIISNRSVISYRML